MEGDPIRGLLSAAAVRERAHEMLALALEGKVEGWRVDLGRLEEAANLTAAVTRPRPISSAPNAWRESRTRGSSS